MSRWIKLALGIGIPLLILLVPSSLLPVPLAVIEQRVLAIFVFAALFWILEPVPVFATSMLVIFALILLASDRALAPFLMDAEGLRHPRLLDHRALMQSLADPIIILFLGGFFLAAAATKYSLDVNLARVILRPCGESPRWVLLGLMGCTAFFSMFMSNTATTAMMLAVVVPVLALIHRDDPGRIAFALAIPFAANIGGIGTPIGTPPNTIAMKFLREGLVDPEQALEGGATLVSFGGWMLFALPFVAILLLFAWGLLLWLFPPALQQLRLSMQGRWRRDSKAWIVYCTSIITVLLWMEGGMWSGLSAPVVALLPIAVYCSTGVLSAQDMRSMGWEVLWLVAGGFALGLALQDSGLAEHIVRVMPFDQMSGLAVFLVAIAVTFVMATFMSHTASANLILPVLAAVATAMPGITALGGAVALILAATISASLAMALPISTPPNALGYASGWIRSRDMLKAGLIIGLVGILLLIALLSILRVAGPPLLRG